MPSRPLGLVLGLVLLTFSLSARALEEDISSRRC